MRPEIQQVLAELETRGEISAEQRERIHAALAQRLDAPRDHGGRVIAIVASFGALLLAAGLLYLVGYNWDALGKAAKLALVFGLWAGIHAGGYALAEQPGRYPRVGRALTLAGILCFGGALALVAQIYNLSAHYPWAVLLWWLLAVPLMLWMRSRTAQALVTGLFVLWAFWHANIWYEDQEALSHSWRYELHCNLYLGGALAAFFGALAAFVASLRAERYVGLWRALAIPGVLFGAYLMGFHDFAEHWGEWRPIFWALTPALCVLAVALLLVLAAMLHRLRGPLLAEAWAALGLVLLCSVLCVWAEEWLPIACNLLLLAALLALAWHGTRTRSAGLVNLALGFFALLIVTRYVEYLWDKLQGAYAFLGCGALLLTLGWFLERRRRSLMLRVRGGGA
jgi:uncharacterized membrane protein